MLAKKRQVPLWDQPENPYTIEPGYEVVTLYMLTYGTLTHSGGNAKNHLVEYGATYLGSFKLKSWAFTNNLAAGFTGNEEQYIIVDLWALASSRSNSDKDLLYTWESNYSIACLEGQRMHPYAKAFQHSYYRPGLIKISRSNHNSLPNDVYAKIYEVPVDSRYDKIQDFVAYKKYTPEELEEIPYLECQ